MLEQVLHFALVHSHAAELHLVLGDGVGVHARFQPLVRVSGSAVETYNGVMHVSLARAHVPAYIACTGNRTYPRKRLPVTSTARTSLRKTWRHLMRLCHSELRWIKRGQNKRVTSPQVEPSRNLPAPLVLGTVPASPKQNTLPSCARYKTLHDDAGKTGGNARAVNGCGSVGGNDIAINQTQSLVDTTDSLAAHVTTRMPARRDNRVLALCAPSQNGHSCCREHLLGRDLCVAQQAYT